MSGPTNGAADRLMPRTTFHEALRRERQGQGRSLADLAKGVSVPASRVEAWELGEELPTKAEFGKLCLHYRRLRHFPPATFAAHRAPPRPVTSPPVIAAAPMRRSFGEHLAAAREAEGMSQDELGSTLDVTGQAVSAWELGKQCPVRANYEALLALLPPLREAPDPDWRDLEVPDGGRGQGRVPQARDRVEGARDEPARAGEEPAADPQRLVDAYAEVRGGRWEVEVTVEVRRADGEGSCVGRGEDVAACCASLLSALEREVEDRIARLKELRASLRVGKTPS